MVWREVSHLFDPESNPMLAREWCRYRRRWLPLVVLLLLGWVPTAWLFRVQLLRNAPMINSSLGELLFLCTSFWLRPDILTGIFLAYRAFRQEEWQSLRRDIALTHLTSAQILAGKCAIPVAIGVLLNVTSTPFYYESLRDPRTSFISLAGIDVWTGGLILVFAVLEDIFFSTLVVLLSVRGFLGGDDPLASVLRSLGAIALRGSVIGLLSALAGQVYLLAAILLLGSAGAWIQLIGSGQGWDFLFSNAIFMLIVLPAEWLLLRRLVSQLRRDLPGYLTGERLPPESDTPPLRGAE